MSQNHYRKDIEKTFKHAGATNQLDEAKTFSDATAKFNEMHKNISNYSDFKLNPDLILSAMNIVENLYDKSYKTDKKLIVINMLKSCLTSKGGSYSDVELKSLDQIIESLHSNHLVKKIPRKTVRRLSK